MKIVIVGATGFIGRHLAADLKQHGHSVLAISRKQSSDVISWDPANKRIDIDQLQSFDPDAVVNLAGESVACRWSPRKKDEIYQSRVPATAFLASTLSGLKRKPQVFLCASAIGYYGERGAEFLTEDSLAGSTFLSKVCADWEASAAQASQAGIRTIRLRFGIVLSTTGGAFPRMLAPFQMGAGGRLGTGHQYMSWITMADTLASIRFSLATAMMEGPVNIVSPHPVTNNEFTETLGKLMHVPTLVPVPVTMAHLAFGSEMSDQVLLASDRVLPERLMSCGFKFEHPTLQEALAHVLSHKA